MEVEDNPFAQSLLPRKSPPRGDLTCLRPPGYVFLHTLDCIEGQVKGLMTYIHGKKVDTLKEEMEITEVKETRDEEVIYIRLQNKFYS